MASEPDLYLEATLELHASGNPEHVAGWLEAHNLTALPLVTGMLTGGETAALRAAFGAPPEPGGTLPVPDELSGDVATVRVVAPRQLH